MSRNKNKPASAERESNKGSDDGHESSSAGDGSDVYENDHEATTYEVQDDGQEENAYDVYDQDQDDEYQAGNEDEVAEAEAEAEDYQANTRRRGGNNGANTGKKYNSNWPLYIYVPDNYQPRDKTHHGGKWQCPVKDCDDVLTTKEKLANHLWSGKHQDCFTQKRLQEDRAKGVYNRLPKQVPTPKGEPYLVLSWVGKPSIPDITVQVPVAPNYRSIEDELVRGLRSLPPRIETDSRRPLTIGVSANAIGKIILVVNYRGRISWNKKALEVGDRIPFGYKVGEPYETLKNRGPAFELLVRFAGLRVVNRRGPSTAVPSGGPAATSQPGPQSGRPSGQQPKSGAGTSAPPQQPASRNNASNPSGGHSAALQLGLSRGDRQLPVRSRAMMRPASSSGATAKRVANSGAASQESSPLPARDLPTTNTLLPRSSARMSPTIPSEAASSDELSDVEISDFEVGGAEVSRATPRDGDPSDPDSSDDDSSNANLNNAESDEDKASVASGAKYSDKESVRSKMSNAPTQPEVMVGAPFPFKRATPAHYRATFGVDSPLQQSVAGSPPASILTSHCGKKIFVFWSEPDSAGKFAPGPFSTLDRQFCYHFIHDDDNNTPAALNNRRLGAMEISGQASGGAVQVYQVLHDINTVPGRRAQFAIAENFLKAFHVLVNFQDKPILALLLDKYDPASLKDIFEALWSYNDGFDYRARVPKPKYFGPKFDKFIDQGVKQIRYDESHTDMTTIIDLVCAFYHDGLCRENKINCPRVAPEWYDNPTPFNAQAASWYESCASYLATLKSHPSLLCLDAKMANKQVSDVRPDGQLPRLEMGAQLAPINGNSATVYKSPYAERPAHQYTTLSEREIQRQKNIPTVHYNEAMRRTCGCIPQTPDSVFVHKPRSFPCGTCCPVEMCPHELAASRQNGADYNDNDAALALLMLSGAIAHEPFPESRNRIEQTPSAGSMIEDQAVVPKTARKAKGKAKAKMTTHPDADAMDVDGADNESNNKKTKAKRKSPAKPTQTKPKTVNKGKQPAKAKTPSPDLDDNMEVDDTVWDSAEQLSELEPDTPKAKRSKLRRDSDADYEEIPRPASSAKKAATPRKASPRKATPKGAASKGKKKDGDDKAYRPGK